MSARTSKPAAQRPSRIGKMLDGYELMPEGSTVNKGCYRWESKWRKWVHCWVTGWTLLHPDDIGLYIRPVAGLPTRRKGK